jgi:hypothetical protein
MRKTRWIVSGTCAALWLYGAPARAETEGDRAPAQSTEGDRTYSTTPSTSEAGAARTVGERSSATQEMGNANATESTSMTEPAPEQPALLHAGGG